MLHDAYTKPYGTLMQVGGCLMFQGWHSFFGIKIEEKQGL